MSRGFILIEVTIAYVLLAVALVALLPVFIMAIRAGKSTEQVQTATGLSQELLEEIRLRKWDQNVGSTPGWIANPSTAPGVDAGESAANKTTFNDIDDFNGWTETGAKDPLNNALSAFTGYTRTVSVSYVDDGMVVQSTPTVTAYKLVTVCTQTAKLHGICLKSLFTNR